MVNHLYVEELKLPTLCFVILPLMFKRKNRAAVTVEFVDASMSARAIVKFASKFIHGRITPLELVASEELDEAGTAIWLKGHYQGMVDARAELLNNAVFREMLLDDGESKYKRYYYIKRCLPDRHPVRGPGLWRSIYLAHIFGNRHARVDKRNHTAVAIFKHVPWITQLEGYLERSANMQVVLSGRLWMLGDVLLRIWKRLLINVRDNISFAGQQAHKAGGYDCNHSDITKIAVQCYGQANITRLDHFSDLFFLFDSPLSGSQVIALNAIPGAPFDQVTVNELRRNGITPIVQRPRASTVSEIPVFRHSAFKRKIIRSCKILAASVKPMEARWAQYESQVFLDEKEYWLSLFKKYDVKAYINWFKYDASHCAIGAALDEIGGVLGIYQRSFEGNPSVKTTIASDLAFGFSSLSADVERASGSEVSHYIITGFTGDYRFPHVRKAAADVRKRILSNGAHYIAAFFDENSFEDPRWGGGHETQQELYLELLEHFMSDPKLGLVIKPKTPHSLRRRLGPVAVLLDAAIETGRCYVYEDAILQSVAPPVQAALSADLVVHGSVFSATAGIEAALSGVPTVFFDHEGYKDGVFYSLCEGKLVYNDWSVLWEEWQRYREGIQGTEGFADWSGCIDRFDPFRDGLAAHRMGEYLAELVAGFADGLDKKSALTRASEYYAASWGSENVLSIQASV